MKTLVRFRKHCFAGLTLVGVLAGVFDHLWLGAAAHYSIFLGMLSVILSASMGGFVGFFGLNMLRTIRRRKPYMGQHNDGVLLFGLCGAFAGVLLNLLVADQFNPILGAATGAFFGGAVGAIPDQFIQPMLLLADGAQKPEATDISELVFVEPVQEE